MKLSSLQKFILKESFGVRGKILRNRFHKFYDSQKSLLNRLSQVKIISKSIDRLIDKGLLVGFGQKTQHKLFIKEVCLTAKGKALTKKLLGEQKSLPFKKRKK